MEAGTLKIEDIQAKIDRLTPEEAYEEIKAGGDFVLLDTREPHEYARGPPRGRDAGPARRGRRAHRRGRARHLASA